MLEQDSDRPGTSGAGEAVSPDGEHCRRVFRAMLEARTLENKLSSLYKAGRIVGGVYMGKGQEAVSASLGACLVKGRDLFSPLIRDQAGRTAFGEEMLDATRTYLGSVKGPMRGRDGNVHRGRPAEGLLAMISHLGSSAAVVAGMLMARRMKGTLAGCVGATCIGDGGTSTGAFHEGINLAAVERLPMVVVVANNQFAYSTPNRQQFACADLLERAEGYGIAGHDVDGTDFMECVEVMRLAVEAARTGAGPRMVVARMLRLSGHGEHDDGAYVPRLLREALVGRDCLEVARGQMLAKQLATREEMEAWEKEAAEQVQEAAAIAQREEKPDPFQTDWRACSEAVTQAS